LFDIEQDYPRDLIGYGRNRPRPVWPGEARVAVQFVINYEEGGENCVLHGVGVSSTRRLLRLNSAVPSIVFEMADLLAAGV
jgi:hypothetical protein